MKIDPERLVEVSRETVASIIEGAEFQDSGKTYPAFCDSCGYSERLGLLGLARPCPSCSEDPQELLVFNYEPQEGWDDNTPLVLHHVPVMPYWSASDNPDDQAFKMSDGHDSLHPSREPYLSTLFSSRTI